MGKVELVKQAVSLAKTVAPKLQPKKATKFFSNIRAMMLNETSVFSFAQKHPLEQAGKLSEDGIVLSHLTDWLPKDGVILSNRAALGGSRNSVHFAVNHTVTPHAAGDWSGRKYGIIMPLKAARRVKGNHFVGGQATDFYSAGSVKLPKGSYIVRRNPDLPNGTYRILEASKSKIDEFKKLHGVRVIETSHKDIPKVTSWIMEKLGYERRVSIDSMTWGEAAKMHENVKKFNEFLLSKKMLPAFHTFTPNGQIDLILVFTHQRDAVGKGWQIVKDGKVLVDYKKEFLKQLDVIAEMAKTKKYPVDIDIAELKKIYESAGTPKDALDMVYRKFGVRTIADEKSMADVIKFKDYELPLYNAFSLSLTKNRLSVMLDYLSNPNIDSYAKSLQNPLFDLPEELSKLFEPEFQKLLQAQAIH